MGRFPRPDTDIGAVYERYSDMLFRIALLQTGNREDAMDVVQDVFLRFTQKTVLFFSEEHEKAWFIRSTINRCRDIYRKNSLRNHGELTEAENASYKEYFSEENLTVPEALEQLPEKIRSVMILHYLEGFSIEEIAKMLVLSASAVKMRLSRGREALREILGKEEKYV